jgi:hypothetical protein
MKKWISLFTLLLTLTSLAQSGYNYSFTDPCTLSTKSVFVPAGSGVMVNYFDNHNTFTTNDFSSGVFDAWIAQVSQQNSSSPCSQVTAIVTNNVTTIVVSNTVSIVTNVVAISSLAQSMASLSSSIGSSMSATAGGISNMGTGNAVDNNQSNSNGKSDNKSGGSTGSNQTNNQNEGGTTPNTGTGGNNTPTGGTGTGQGGNTSDTNQPTQGGEQTSQPSVEGGSTSGASGSTANSISNSIDGGGSEGGSSSGGGSSSSSKKQAAAKTSSGSLIASGDMVAISSADKTTANQYKIVASMTHANTRGTRIKGVLFNYTTGANNMNITLYKSWINKSKSLNTIVANSTMMDFEKNIFNTTTGLESYKVTKNLTGMFGLNFTAGKMGERGFYNLSAVGGGHVSAKVTDRTSTSFLVLAIYSPFTQFYDGKWFGAGILFVPFSSWDFKITKTFKYNVSFTGVYEMNQSFLNYQILTGGKLSF